jgi:hypothetical protein
MNAFKAKPAQLGVPPFLSTEISAGAQRLTKAIEDIEDNEISFVDESPMKILNERPFMGTPKPPQVLNPFSKNSAKIENSRKSSVECSTSSKFSK